MSIAIKVENLSKLYRLGEIGTGTLSYDMQRWLAKMRGKEDPFLKIGEANDRTTKGSDIVYSLHDLNFEIQQGDAVGIIGRNGAGKSTLLKILSRVTSPTTGRINIKGRVASLLEVGTGFHPELTGKENIYLNGAILGMRKKEIDRRLEEIIDFSGVERYINTPVKRYSSGMYVRLAFAVAAHLESEILIVDEVLAVGDAEFQKKCLGKMGEVSKGDGKTILFVSHNMVAIKALCNKGIYLQNGKVKQTGDINESIHAYLNNTNSTDTDGNIPPGSSTYYTGKIRFKKLRMLDVSSGGNAVFYRSPIKLYAEIEADEDFTEMILDMRICTDEGLIVAHAGNLYNRDVLASTTLRKGINRVQIEIDNHLQPGRYSLSPGVHLKDGTSMDYIENILGFEVLKLGYGENPGYEFNWNMGIIRFDSKWNLITEQPITKINYQ
jgi:lipopolysaccharide transport system ATP-binding protein